MENCDWRSERVRAFLGMVDDVHITMSADGAGAGSSSSLSPFPAQDRQIRQFPHKGEICSPSSICTAQVVLIIEILHTFSRYLEAVVLIPQFVLLYKRQKYD